MHENMSFKYIHRIIKPRSTSEAILGIQYNPDPSIQDPSKQPSYASRVVLIDVGRMTASSVLLSIASPTSQPAQAETLSLGDVNIHV